MDETKLGRYVRIYANEKSKYGCSLYEFDVYGNYQIETEVSSILVLKIRLRKLQLRIDHYKCMQKFYLIQQLIRE